MWRSTLPIGKLFDMEIFKSTVHNGKLYDDMQRSLQTIRVS